MFNNEFVILQGSASNPFYGLFGLLTTAQNDLLLSREQQGITRKVVDFKDLDVSFADFTTNTSLAKFPGLSLFYATYTSKFNSLDPSGTDVEIVISFLQANGLA